MAPPRRVLIVGTQRSGTSVTHVCLAGHPQVAALAEEMHTMFFSSTAPGDGEAQLFLDTFDFLAGARDGIAVCAMKTALPSAAHASQLAACLATNGRGLDLVVVRRADLVAQLGSLRLAEQTGTWHRRGGEAAAAGRVALTADEVERYVAECAAIDACVDTLRDGRRVLDLGYEEHIATGAAWPLLFRFLGIDDVAPTWIDMGKRSPEPEAFIDDYATWSERVRAIAARARAHAAVPPPPLATPARIFLLFRAQMQQQRGQPLQALADALASIAAPAGHGVETLEWASRTIADALDALGDVERARRVVGMLHSRHAGDPHVDALVRRVRKILGEAG